MPYACKKKRKEYDRRYQSRMTEEVKEARRIKHRECYAKNKESKAEYGKVRHEKGKQRRLHVLDAMGGKCCRCGYSKCSSAIEFHHVGDKEFQISNFICSRKHIQELMTEAKKCILLCANCHREEHHG